MRSEYIFAARWLMLPGRQPWYVTWCSVGADMPSVLQSMAESCRLNAQSLRKVPTWSIRPTSGSNTTSVMVSGAMAML